MVGSSTNKGMNMHGCATIVRARRVNPSQAGPSGADEDSTISGGDDGGGERALRKQEENCRSDVLGNFTSPPTAGRHWVLGSFAV